MIFKSERTTMELSDQAPLDWSLVSLRISYSLTFNVLSPPLLRRLVLSGFIYRSCGEDGWSEPYPPYEDACKFIEYNDTEPEVNPLWRCHT